MSDICPGSEPTEDRRGETGVFGAGLVVEERDQIVKWFVHFVARFLVMGWLKSFALAFRSSRMRLAMLSSHSLLAASK